MEPILSIRGLKTSFFAHGGEVQAVRGVDITVEKGEIFGIVGESGSGKSVTLMSILRLIEHPGKIKSGEIIFNGTDILTIKEKALEKIRGAEISMIFQDPMSSLNPVYTIGNQIVETLRTHRPGLSAKEAKVQAIDLLRMVGIPSPEKRIGNYPHEFSGGMRQRAMIAMALACDPKLLIADEPTTALDVTIQAQIIDLIKRIQTEKETTVILVTHDLGVVADMCSRVAVMYGGLVMEMGSADDIFYSPRHPYTVGLLQSVPVSGQEGKGRLQPIEGSPIDLFNPPDGCPFAYRCNHAMEICLEQHCELLEIDGGHVSACWLNHPEAPQLQQSPWEVSRI